VKLLAGAGEALRIPRTWNGREIRRHGSAVLSAGGWPSGQYSCQQEQQERPRISTVEHDGTSGVRHQDAVSRRVPISVRLHVLEGRFSTYLEAGVIGDRAPFSE